MSASRRLVPLLLLATISACRRDASSPEASAAVAPPTAAAPAPASVASPSGDVVDEFLRLNRIDGIVDAWSAEMERQWDVQVEAMRVKPPPGFWAESLKDYDMAEQRRALAEAVRAGIPLDEMQQDVTWMRESDVARLGAQLDAVQARVAPLQAALAAEAARAAARASGQSPPSGPPIAASGASLSGDDRARLHRLMDLVGYGAPDALAPRLVQALKESLSEAPAATWTDESLLAASRDVARGIEAAFAQEWTPQEAERLADALDSPGGRRHDALMERLTPIVMARSQPFMESLQKHVLRRYARIYNVAWEEHERQKKAAAGSP